MNLTRPGSLAFVASQLFAIASSLIAQNRPLLTKTAEIVDTIKTDGHRPAPVWSGTSTLSVEVNRTSEPIIWSTGRTGKSEEIRFSIPEAQYILVWGLAGAKDGTVVVYGSAYNADQKGGSFLAILPPNRTKQRIVQLFPFYADVATVCDDGTIWAIGDDEARRRPNVLKRFSSTCSLISSQDLAIRGRFTEDASQDSSLHSSTDRVGWMTNTYQYVEFSLDGKEISRTSGPPWHPITPLFTSFSISDKADVVAAIQQPTQSEALIWLLDRKTKTWKPLDTSAAKIEQSARFLGFDGEELVVRNSTAERGNFIIRLGISAPNE